MIRTDFSGQQLRAMLCIAVDSYGQSRKESGLSINEIANMMGVSNQRANAAIQALVPPKIVVPLNTIQNRGGHKIMRLINKDYDQWGTIQKRGTIQNRGTNTIQNRGTPLRLTTERARGISGVNVFKKEKNTAPKRFIPPTPQEVTAYGLEIGFPIDGEHFVNHYLARGWRFKGGDPVRDWKACVRTWKKNGFNQTKLENKSNGLDIN